MGDEAGSAKGASRLDGLRAGLGVAIVLALGLGSTGSVAYTRARERVEGRAQADNIGGLEAQRFGPVKAKLPPRGVFEYRTLAPLRLTENLVLEGKDGSIEHYMVAQYVLAPRVLDFRAEHPLVVYDTFGPVRLLRREGP